MKQFVRGAGLVLFMGSLATLGWWWVFVAGDGRPGGRWQAAAIDSLVFSAFALHHSLMARPRSRMLVERLVPPDLVRTTYVWAASLLLFAVCVLWQPVGSTLYRVTGFAALPFAAVQIAGAIVGLLAVQRISVRELAGLAEPRESQALEFRGPYALVRHPLYLGWVLVLFGTAHMTGDRLLFAVVSTGYLLAAMPLEEAGLQRQFGERYLEYRRAVRWRLIPYIH
jgi:methanethiol S-methyltransferase